jgi:hypothetical protein
MRSKRSVADNEVDEPPRYRDLLHNMFPLQQVAHTGMILDYPQKVIRRQAGVREYLVTEFSVDLDDILSKLVLRKCRVEDGQGA